LFCVPELSILLFVSTYYRKRWARLLICEHHEEVISKLRIVTDFQRPQQYLCHCLNLHRVLTRWWLRLLLL
jgi:hypothetical protein